MSKIRRTRKPDRIVLRVTSVFFSAFRWLLFRRVISHGDTEHTEIAQRRGNAVALRWLLVVLGVLMFSACSQQMGTQPHVRPLEPNAIFPNKQSARPLVAGTVPTGYTRTNHKLEPLISFDPNADTLPFLLTSEVLERGRERYNIYCSACHGLTGEGNGMVVQRGFSRPPSYFEPRLRQAPLGHFYDVIKNGYGAMASYAVQVEPQDRWAIAAYVRTLQVSRSVPVAEVPAEKRAQLEQGGATK